MMEQVLDAAGIARTELVITSYSIHYTKLYEARVGKASALLALGRADEAKSIALKLSGKRETRGDGSYNFV